ncbi:AMP-binding protein [Sediminivirga luteola]|uniref:AMP-dependent synthetase/ligase domain-containing protein n=1 Tax=Sediminivirga luteola TaxID=1774748 RepID=A0A8J2XB23_9MICO|nr:AMP-binding protein [Sediminivirga luteola]GGA02224.1 hypothetical protein GCM10011333_00940 [Sediminivirga luteola]
MARDPLAVLPALEAALDGSGPPLVLPATADSPWLTVTDPGEARGLALIARTSGSTGEPKAVALPAAALRASAEATAAHLGGPGAWLLALPVHHIAGAQVLLRSLHAGTRPFVSSPGPFTAEGFSADVAAMQAALEPGGRRYTALVPTQIARLLDDPEALARAAWFDAILVGGAALHPSLHDRATEAGLHLVRTYGMTETCGGVVYDRMPLPGVDLDIDPQGRIVIAAPMVASGYADIEADGTAARLRSLRPFEEVPGLGRRFRTSDLGSLQDGMLSVHGRADDVLISGGENVSPALVEAALLRALPGLRQAIVTGVDDPEWGTRIVALLQPEQGPEPAPASAPDAPGGASADAAAADRVPDPGTGGGTPAAAWWAGGDVDLARLRSLLSGRLPAAALPRQAFLVESLPERGIGKPDRAAAKTLAGRLASREFRFSGPGGPDG